MSSQTQLALQSMSTEQIQMQYALDAFRRKYGDPSDDNVSMSWSELHKNEILKEYLELEKASHTMSMCNLRLRFLGKKMWHGFGSNDFNLIYKLLDHLDIIAGHSTLSQLFCAQITSVSKNVRRILMNNPFKLRAHLHLKPFCKNFNDTDSVISHMTSKQKLYDVTDLCIDLHHISCIEDLKKFKKLICDFNAMTSITLTCPTTKRSDKICKAFFGGVSEMLKNINRLTIYFHGYCYHLQELVKCLLEIPLEFLNVEAEMVDTNSAEIVLGRFGMGKSAFETQLTSFKKRLTSLKHVVVREFHVVEPVFLLLAPNILKFECHLDICPSTKYGVNSIKDDIEAEKRVFQRCLTFVENFEILEEFSVNIKFRVETRCNIHYTKYMLDYANDIIIQEFRTYIQRAKNKKLRRLDVFDSVLFEKPKPYIPSDLGDWVQGTVLSKRQEELENVSSNIQITTNLGKLGPNTGPPWE